MSGAAKYEIEMNTDEGFTSGGKVCCQRHDLDHVDAEDAAAERHVLLARARGRLERSAGDWNVYGGGDTGHVHDSFVTGTGAITNLRMVDNQSDPGRQVARIHRRRCRS